MKKNQESLTETSYRKTMENVVIMNRMDLWTEQTNRRGEIVYSYDDHILMKRKRKKNV